MQQSAYKQIVARYGRPDVDVFDEDSYRVVLWDWHIHTFAMHGQLSGYGHTLEEACERLLAAADKSGAMVVEGSCNFECERRYWASPAYEISRNQFGSFVLKNFNKKKVKKGK